MGIQADCERFEADWSTVAGCVEATHSARLDAYGAAIASKFETGADFTVSDVWPILIAVWELPANGLQLLIAQHVWFHDFFELDVNAFTDPTPFLATPLALLSLAMAGAIVASRN